MAPAARRATDAPRARKRTATARTRTAPYSRSRPGLAALFDACAQDGLRRRSQVAAELTHGLLAERAARDQGHRLALLTQLPVLEMPAVLRERVERRAKLARIERVVRTAQQLELSLKVRNARSVPRALRSGLG